MINISSIDLSKIKFFKINLRYHREMNFCNIHESNHKKAEKKF